jgi:hypothetical protein
MVYKKLPRELPVTRGYRSNFVGTLAEAHGHPAIIGSNQMVYNRLPRELSVIHGYRGQSNGVYQTVAIMAYILPVNYRLILNLNYS